MYFHLIIAKVFGKRKFLVKPIITFMVRGMRILRSKEMIESGNFIFLLS